MNIIQIVQDIQYTRCNIILLWLNGYLLRYPQPRDGMASKNEEFVEITRKVVFYVNAWCFNDYQTKMKQDKRSL